MDANGRELILKDEVYANIPCALEIINGIGHGLHEKPHENSLAVEFRDRGIPFIQQPKYPVLWRNLIVGEFIPDLIVYRQIIVDTKTIEHITPIERGQMLNHLRIAGLPLGLIINFKKPKLDWERIILSS